MAWTAFSNSMKSAFPTHPKQIIITDEDVTHFSIAHPKRLPWFGSLLLTEDSAHAHHSHNSNAIADDDSDYDSAGEKHTSIVDEGEPPLQRHHEAPVIQLFYDLFFVANLTTFTGVHEVNDKETLKSYIGFFGMLWFTWLQVTLFDIRFGIDSAFERLCKALQFGVMTGFAIVGPAYKTGWEKGDKEVDKTVVAFQTLSIILMVSRLVLVIQYTVVLVWLRGFRKTLLPLLIHILVLFASAMIFLGLYFSFGRESGDDSLIAWYVTIGIESGVILLLSAKWRFLSFRATNIVERLGLLTLIILGEGIIGLCSAIQKVGSDQKFGADIIGMIICGIVIIYCLWMLYFDQSEAEKVGTVRQLIWTMLHFPYHCSVLFVLEGTNQLSTWRKLIDSWDSLDNRLSINTIIPPTTDDSDDLNNYVTAINQTMTQWFHPYEEGLGKLKIQTPDLQPIFENIQNLAKDSLSENNATAFAQAVQGNVTDIFSQGAVFAAKNFGIEPPEKKAEDATESGQVLGLLLDDTFSTIFIYFFVAAGLAILFTTMLFIFGKRHKIRGDYFNIFFRIIIGTGILLVSIIATAKGGLLNDAYSNFAGSPYMLPTVAIAYFVIVVVDNLLINYVRSLVLAAQNEQDV